jgi:glycosyltransferase involved in cell wall biosynthesis
MKVSIIITAYGRKNFLEEALESAVKQSGGNIETEIILVKNFRDPRIDSICESSGVRVIEREGTIGEYLSEATVRATGEIIMFLEDDDVFASDKARKIVDLFSCNGDVLLIHNNYFAIDESSRKIEYKRLLDKHHSPEDFNLIFDYKSEKLSDFISSSNADFNLSCMCIRKEAITPDFLSFLYTIRSNPDAVLLYYSLSMGGKVLATGDVLTKYRVHEQGISQSKNFGIKADEVQKELDALLKLKTFLSERRSSPQSVLKLMDLVIAEFTLMLGLFQRNLSRLKMLRMVLKLVIFDMRVHNTMRSRLIVFGILNAISADFAARLYGFLRAN